MKFKKVLLYGQGNGRDHTNHLEMMKSKNIEFCSLIKKENALMLKYDNVFIVKNLNEAVDFAKEYKPDLVIVSNRADFEEGATDIFEKEGFLVFGISQKASELESNKTFAKQFMNKYNILTPRYFLANSIDEAIKYVTNNWKKTNNGFALKVSQFSKNSFNRTSVPKNLKETISEIKRLFNSTENVQLIIEEKLIGYEISLHLFVKGNKYSIMPLVQDYKRKYPNNKGPMTSGACSVAETITYPNNLIEVIENDIVISTISGLIAENINYSSILYIGIFVDEKGIPYVLEYNTRSGNPEWLALTNLLNKPLINVIESFYDNFEDLNNCWKKNSSSIAWYAFSSKSSKINKIITNIKITNIESIKEGTDIIGENIISKDEILYSSGDRVFSLRRVGYDFDIVKKELIEDFRNIKMKGMYYRSDIKTIIKNI